MRMGIGASAPTVDSKTLGHGFACTSTNVYHTHMQSADPIRVLRQSGWVLDRVRGSHHVFRHPERPGIVVVPHPKKDLGLGLVKAIRRQAGI